MALQHLSCKFVLKQAELNYYSLLYSVYQIVLSDVSGATRRNWNDARMYCLAMGADLASFHSQAEEDYILSGYPDK